MIRATWNGSVIAESNDTVIVEGNHYFPLDSVVDGVLIESPTTSVCPWKGAASYYSINVGGDTNTDAAFWYPTPKPEAAQIRDRVAFWKGVTVESVDA